MIILRIALRNLIQSRRRTSLLIAAIGTVTAFLVILLSISRGISDNLVDSATTLSAGHVNVAGFYKVTASEPAPIVTNKESLKALIVENTEGIDYVTDRHRGWGKIISSTQSVQAGLTGIDLEQEPRFADQLRLAPESAYYDGGSDEPVGDLTKLSDPNTLMLFEDQARRLGLRVGDLVTIQTETLSGRTNTIDVTLVAVAEDLGLLSSWVAIVPKSTIFELYQLNEDTTGAIWIYLKDINQAEAKMREVRTMLAENGYQVMDHEPLPFFMKFESVAGEDWTGQKLDVTVWKDEVSYLLWVLTTFDSVTWFLVAILVAIIAVGIMNTMWNSVRERTREIGTMRAMGMQRGRVLRLILLEAALLGFAASTLGSLVGAGFALGADAMEISVPIEAFKVILLADTFRFSVHAGVLVAAVVVLSMFTTLAAAWPAVRAARLRPITAIQHVD